MFSIAREQSARQGLALSNRFTVRAFRTAQAMHKFLSTQDNNAWRILDHPVKTGVYFQQYDSRTRGFKMININALK